MSVIDAIVYKKYILNFIKKDFTLHIQYHRKRNFFKTMQNI